MSKGTLQIAYDKLVLENLELRAIKCPPISEGDSCICPIEKLRERITELETALENIRVVPRNFKSGMTYAKRMELMIDIAEQALKG